MEGSLMTPDIDDVAVERACKGDRTVSLNRDEMAAAFHQLQARKLSAREIGSRLGVAERTWRITQWRVRRRHPEATRRAGAALAA
jgi:hypothetical protein